MIYNINTYNIYIHICIYIYIYIFNVLKVLSSASAYLRNRSFDRLKSSFI